MTEEKNYAMREIEQEYFVRDFWWRIPWSVLAKRPGGMRYNQLLIWLEDEHNEVYNHWVSIEKEYRKEIRGNYDRILTWLEEEYIEIFNQWGPVLEQIEVERDKAARESAKKRGWVL